jgi:hypothetical protein
MMRFGSAAAPTLLAAFTIGLCTACGESSTTPTPSVPADLTGTWTGQIGLPGTGAAVRVVWAALQPGNTASGRATLTKPAIGIEIPGVMVGVVDRQQVSLSFVAPVAPMPTLPNCSVVGTGSGTTAGSSITGTFSLIVSNCSDAIESVTNVRLTLSR